MGDAVAWAQLSKGRTTLSTKLIAIQWISDCKTFYAIHRIEIHPLDNVVQPSNLFSRLNPSLRGLGGGEEESDWTVFHKALHDNDREN